MTLEFLLHCRISTRLYKVSSHAGVFEYMEVSVPSKFTDKTLTLNKEITSEHAISKQFRILVQELLNIQQSEMDLKMDLS